MAACGFDPIPGTLAFSPVRADGSSICIAYISMDIICGRGAGIRIEDADMHVHYLQFGNSLLANVIGFMVWSVSALLIDRSCGRGRQRCPWHSVCIAIKTSCYGARQSFTRIIILNRQSTDCRAHGTHRWRTCNVATLQQKTSHMQRFPPNPICLWTSVDGRVFAPAGR